MLNECRNAGCSGKIVPGTEKTYSSGYSSCDGRGYAKYDAPQETSNGLYYCDRCGIVYAFQYPRGISEEKKPAMSPNTVMPPHGGC